MRYGYARISTYEGKQEFSRQRDALVNAGVPEENIFYDEMSGSVEHRPSLDKMLSTLKADDSVTVLEFSRLSRSLTQLLDLSKRFNEQGIDLISLHENIDTTTPEGRLFYSICGAFSQYERELTVQRINEGLNASRARGTKFGRPKADAKAIDTAMALYRSTNLSSVEICGRTGISRSTLYRYAKERGVEREAK